MRNNVQTILLTSGWLLNYLFFPKFAESQEPFCSWGRNTQSTSPSSESSYGEDVAVDQNGMIYFIGNFETPNIELGPFNSQNMAAIGSSDIFLAKADSNGTILWLKSMGGISLDRVSRLTVDHFGHLYFCGSFASPSVSAGGATVYGNGGQPNFILVSYDTNGNFRWMHGGNGDSWGHDMCTDQYGTVYFTGQFAQTITIGSTTLIPGNNNDAFIAKFDSSGNSVWAKSFSSTQTDIVHFSGITTDSQNNLLLCGVLRGSRNFGNFSLSSNNSSGEALIIKCDSSGQAIWGHCGSSLSSNFGTHALDVTCCTNQDIILCGFQNGGFSFGSNSLSAAGLFVARFDSSGQIKWLKGNGGTPQTSCQAVVSNLNSACFVTGYYLGDIFTLDSFVLYGNVLNKNLFVASFDSLGEVQWLLAGNSDASYGKGIALGKQDEIYLSGTFKNYFNRDSCLLSSAFNLWSGALIKFNPSFFSETIMIQKEMVSIYPNPNSGSFQLRLRDPDYFNSRILIVDDRGKTHFEKQYLSLPQSISLQLPDGIYVLIIGNETNQIRQLIQVRR